MTRFNRFPLLMQHFVACLCLLLIGMLCAATVQAELNIRVTKRAPDSLPLAIVINGSAPAPSVASIINANLSRTGKFTPMSAQDLPQRPASAEQIDYASWSGAGQRYLALGTLRAAGGNLALQLELFDVVAERRLNGWNFEGASGTQRRMAHRASDAIYQQLLDEEGPFDSRVAYVSTSRNSAGERVYRLNIADSDGQSPFVVMQHTRPVLSPAWSPDGRRIAYVAYEDRNQMVIYIQQLSTGQRSVVTRFPGINGSPAWSPDGRFLAVTLSRGGSPDIFIVPVSGGPPRQLTNNPAIDTEPAWSADGQHIYFTSDRAGGPQIYRVPARGGRATRVTRSGNYNASPAVSPDGSLLTFVTASGGDYRIAVMDADGGDIRSLSAGPLDESPSFAPNGSLILYAAGSDEAGTLGAVSVDGRISQRIDLPAQGVREPAWSPSRRR